MSRFILVPTMLAVTLAVTVAGCNRFPDLSLQIESNLAPDETDCSVTDDQDTVLPAGRLDLAFGPRDYIITPRVESYIVTNALEFQAEQGNIQVTSFEITILLPDGTKPVLAGDLPNPYQVATSAVLPPSEEGGDVSQSAAFALAIPSSYYDALLGIVADTGFQSISIDIRANGTTAGGFSQQSPPFRWPIEFCNGCLGTVCVEPAEVLDAVGCFPGQDLWAYCAVIVQPEL